MMRMLAVAMACLAIALAAGSAAAGSVAKEQFTTARERFDQADYEGALALFRLAFKESGSPNARLYIGRCLHKLGRFTEAYDELHSTIRDADAKARDNAKYGQTRDAATAELALVELRVGKLVIVIHEASPDVKVSLDGAAVAGERLGVPIAVEPGTHRVVASGPDSDIEQKVTVGRGETKAVALWLDQPEAAPCKGTPGGSSWAGAGRTVSLRTLGFVTAGVGLAALVVSAATRAAAGGKLGTLEDECGEGVRCTDPTLAGVIDSGKSLETAAGVSLAIGLLGIAGGGAMIFFGWPPSGGEAAASLGVSPAGATLSFRAVF